VLIYKWVTRFNEVVNRVVFSKSRDYIVRNIIPIVSMVANKSQRNVTGIGSDSRYTILPPFVNAISGITDFVPLFIIL